MLNSVSLKRWSFTLQNCISCPRNHYLYKLYPCNWVQELCESQGGCPGLSILMNLMVSMDVKQHWTMLRHWSQFVPNMSSNIRGHEFYIIIITSINYYSDNWCTTPPHQFHLQGHSRIWSCGGMCLLWSQCSIGFYWPLCCGFCFYWLVGWLVRIPDASIYCKCIHVWRRSQTAFQFNELGMCYLVIVKFLTVVLMDFKDHVCVMVHNSML